MSSKRRVIPKKILVKPKPTLELEEDLEEDLEKVEEVEEVVVSKSRPRNPIKSKKDNIELKESDSDTESEIPDLEKVDKVQPLSRRDINNLINEAIPEPDTSNSGKLLETDTRVAFKGACYFIDEQNPEHLTKYLNLFNLSTINRTAFDEIFYMFTNYAAKQGRDISFKLIVNHFASFNPFEVNTLGTFRMIDYIWTIPQINITTLEMVKTIYGELYLDHLRQFISNDSSVEMKLACERLDQVYGKQKTDVYKEAYGLIEEQQLVEGYQNERIRLFLIDRIKARTDHLKVYPYLIPEPSLIDFKSRTDILQQLTNRDRVWEFLTNNDEDELLVESLAPPSTKEIYEFSSFLEIFSDNDLEKVYKKLPEGPLKQAFIESSNKQIDLFDKNGIAASYERMTPSERMTIFSANTELIQGDDLIYYRYLGPVNISIPELVEDPICIQYGGCRMRTCKCFSNNDNDDIDPEFLYDKDWFTGRCDYPTCGREIQSRFKAVRCVYIGESIEDRNTDDQLIRYKGGWIGCYCKWKHAKKDIVIKQYSSVTPDQVKYEEISVINRIRIRMMDFYEEQMNKIKMYDVDEEEE